MVIFYITKCSASNVNLLHLHFSPNNKAARRLIYNWLKPYFQYHKLYDDEEVIAGEGECGIFWPHPLNGCCMLTLAPHRVNFLIKGIQENNDGMKELESRLVKFLSSF